MVAGSSPADESFLAFMSEWLRRQTQVLLDVISSQVRILLKALCHHVRVVKEIDLSSIGSQSAQVRTLLVTPSLVSSVWQSIRLLTEGPRVQAPHEVFCLMVQDIKYRNPFLPPLGLMGDEGPSRESLCGPVCCLLAQAVCGKTAGILGIR